MGSGVSKRSARPSEVSNAGSPTKPVVPIAAEKAAEAAEQIDRLRKRSSEKIIESTTKIIDNEGVSKAETPVASSEQGEAYNDNVVGETSEQQVPQATGDTIATLPLPALDEENDLEHALAFVSEAERDKLFDSYTRFIFGKVEVNNELPYKGYYAIVLSKTLNLHTTEEQAQAMYQRYCNDAATAIPQERFNPVMMELLERQMQVKFDSGHEAWQWYAMYFDDDATSLPVYFNVRYNRMTYERPSTVQAREQGAVQNFEQLVRLSDGMVLTSYVEDSGQRMYLDWESNDWREFPDEWYNDVALLEDGAEGYAHDDVDWTAEDEGPQRVQTLSGKQYDVAMEKGVRMYYSEEQSEWTPMPVALEVMVPSVIKALQRFEAEIPSWSNVNEKVLALRENGYRVDDTIEWKKKEMILAGEDPLLVQLESGDVQFNATAALNAGGTDPNLELAHAALQRELADQKAVSEIHLSRIAALELQVEVAAEVSSKEQEAAALQKRVEQLQSELATVKAGGDIVAEKESTIETLRVELEGAQSKLLSLQTSQRTSVSKLKFDLLALKQKQDALREQVKQDSKAMVTFIMESSTKLQTKCSRAVEDATSELVSKYKFEVRQRKLLYNELQELKGNIRVFCRVRFDDRVKCVIDFPESADMGPATELRCPNPRGEGTKKFEFDRVYSPSSTQEQVFEDTDAVITSVVDGYNTCIIAYGQTGSGKTHTMMGTPENMGVNRRAIRELLKVCDARAEVDFTIQVSLIEIYNERIADLLSDKTVEEQDCQLRMHPKTKAGYISNLTERPIHEVEDVVRCLADGDANRTTAATKMNSHSSRSHLLLIVTVTGTDKVSGQKSVGKLTLVDLAGSERVGKTEATGQRLIEAAAINKSLSALGQVFTALRTSQTHIPYRNSKLTHILQDSLGGDAKCCVFVAVSPAESNLHETVGTLQFGSAIRTIELGPAGKQGKAKAKKGKGVKKG